MALDLIDPKAPLWRNALGVVAAIVLVPVVIIVKLVTMPFERPAKRTADELARYLRNFIEGTGGDWGFDDFTSIPIADPHLESIRKRAALVTEPISKDGLKTLHVLLAEADAIAREQERFAP